MPRSPDKYSVPESYIRFVVHQRDEQSGVETGIFQRAYELRDSAEVTAADRDVIAEVLTWFHDHLNAPERFNRSRSKGHDRRAARGIAWFRSSATEHLQQAHRLKAVLDANGHSVTVVVERRIGYVVYDDAHQVIAEPFAETRTGHSQ